MTSARIRGWLSALLLVVTASVVDFSGVARGEEEGRSSGGGKGSRTAAAKMDGEEVKRAKSEPRGRLPAFYGDLVDAKQREAIYAIQARHTAQLKTLREQIAALETKADEEMEAVLSDEQRKKLERWRAESKAKRVAETKRKRTEQDLP
ncbi:MAG: hypothetical protein ACKPEY_15355 [Planctomycetota bacterium]